MAFSTNMLNFFIFRRGRSLDRCILWCLAVTLSVVYIMIQNGMLLREQRIDADYGELRMQNRLVHSQEEENLRASSDQWSQKQKVIVERPLIYMYTRQLHTPLMYDEICEITRDPERFQDSNVVVFHAKDLPLSKRLVDLRPKPPFADQLWVYFNLESPVHTRRFSNNEALFNFTITPKRSSDLYHPYGYYNIKTEDEEGTFKIKKKTKLITWCASNCKVKFRNAFVRLMKKYISVDVYGDCSRMFGAPAVCQRGSPSCEVFLSTYKFYLALEESLCTDYVTEKYWGALHRGHVPVVLAANHDVMIPGSFINVLDFKTVKHLVSYLRYLDRNHTAYMKYFKWRKKFELDFLSHDTNRGDLWLPQLCDILQDRDWAQRKFVNMSKFYGVRSNCPRYIKKKVLSVIRRGL